MTLLAIPFYKREDLVSRIFSNLAENSKELNDLGIEIVLIDDSPEYEKLSIALATQFHLLNELKTRRLVNETNLGFVKSCNKVFEMGIREERDVILLNSDCLIAPGALSEIISAAQLDEKTAFACPRSNNASIASLPEVYPDNETSFADAFIGFEQISRHLPRFTYVPTAVGFCFYVKWEILSEFGTFDEAYHEGYQEENDLVLRANRAGYRAILANKAFVWHEGSQSFKLAQHSPEIRNSKNYQVLVKRYPEYDDLVRKYFGSPERRTEELLAQVFNQNKKFIVFDLSHVGTYFNGTFEVAIRIAVDAIAKYSEKFDFGLLMDTPAWRFHGLDKLVGVRRLNVADETWRSAAVIRVGQPFNGSQLGRLYAQSAVSVIYMLDTIAMDCGRNSLEFDLSIWHKTMEYTNLVVAISDFTKEQLQWRFRVGLESKLVTSYLSLDSSDYEPKIQRKTNNSPPYVFVVGNSFPHKFVDITCDKLLELTNINIVSLGYSKRSKNSRLLNHQSGNLSEAKMEEIWQSAEVVIFPSHYEGFGLPVMHALARKKPIILRATKLNFELSKLIRQRQNIYFYKTTDQLAKYINEGLPSWKEEADLDETAIQSWSTGIEQVFNYLETELLELRYEALLRRTQVGLYDLLPGLSNIAKTPAAQVGRAVEKLIENTLRIPGLKRAIKPFYESAKRLLRF